MCTTFTLLLLIQFIHMTLIIYVCNNFCCNCCIRIVVQQRRLSKLLPFWVSMVLFGFDKQNRYNFQLFLGSDLFSNSLILKFFDKQHSHLRLDPGL